MPSSCFTKRVASCRLHSLLLACVLALGPALAAPAAGDDKLPATLTVVLDESNPPYLFRDAGGQFQGILKDRWALWAERSGVRVDLQAMNWANAQQRMQAGEADVIDAMFVTDARKPLYDFSAPYADIEVAIFFHKNIGGIVDAASLQGFTVGVQDGDAVIDYLHEHGIDQLEKYTSYEALVEGAAANKTRIFCMDKAPAVYLLTKLGVAGDFRQSAPLYTGQFHRAYRKGNAPLMKLVEDGFASIPQAELKAIDRKWMGEELGSLNEKWQTYARNAAVAVLALMVVALSLIIWNRALRRRVAANTAELRHTLDRLRLSEERWKFALEGAGDAIWDFDVRTGEVQFSSRWPEMLGYAEGELDTTFSAWKGVVHPADKPLVLDKLRACLDGSVATYLSEHRVRCKDGGWKWILSRGKVVSRDADGKALRMIGTRSDITERMQAEEERNRFASIVRSSLTEIYLVDFETLGYEYANDGALRNLGYSMDALRSMTLMDIKPGLTEAELRRIIEPLVRHSKEVVVFEAEHQRADGSLYPVETHFQLAAFEGHPALLSLVLDTTERKEAERQRTAKEAAELANRTKTIFLASMSHELRTPLNSILGFAQLLEYEPAVKAAEAVQKKVAHIRAAGKHLLAMVEDILDLSVIEAGKMTLSMEPVEMLQLLRDCAALTELQAQRSNIAFNYAHDGEGYWVRGDRKRLKQVVVNLLSNAIKYNRDRGAVNFSLSHDEHLVKVAIEDTGFGLSPEQLQRLFEPFNRLGAENSSTEGTGIGLAIVKQLVQAMNGTIDVVSTPGAGSTFTLTFPRSSQTGLLPQTGSA